MGGEKLEEPRSTPGDPSDVGPSEAATALRRVLDSAAFARAARSRDFLAYVASEVLAGRGARLHERTVARYALGHSDGFDGRRTAVARVRATRVRKALERYYESEGVHDGVQVELPVGSYAPVFVRCDSTSREEHVDLARDAASVAVVQLDPLGDPEGTAARLTQSLAGRLQTFAGLKVVLTARRHAIDARGVGQELGVRFVLLCSATGHAAEPLVLTQLMDSVDGRLLWSESVALDLDHRSSSVERWSASAAGRLGDYAGVIMRRTQVEGPAGVESEPRAGLEGEARNAFYRHITLGGEETLLAARSALSSALDDNGSSEELSAMLAFIVGAGLVYSISTDVEGDRAFTERLATQSLALDEVSALAELALAFVAISRRDWPTCITHAQRAAELSPDHPSHLFSAGGALATAGEWEAGNRLMRRSFELNPFHPPYQHANLALERLVAGDLAGVLAEASIVDEGAGVWGPFCRALALRGLGHVEQARSEMTAALQFMPDLLTDPDFLFEQELIVSPEQRETVMALLRPFMEPGQQPGGAADQ
jgi:TolB-like protein